MTRFIIAIIGCIIAGAIFFFYTKPAYDQVRTLKAQIAQYNQALEKANELQRLKQELLARYNAFNPADVERLGKLLPDHVDNVRLLLDLDNLAASHSLALRNVAISGPTDPQTEQPTVDANAVIAENAQAYDSLTFKFNTQGTYPTFMTFMEDLERSLRIVDLVSLSLQRAATDAKSAEPVYSYDVTIRTYWLK